MAALQRRSVAPSSWSLHDSFVTMTAESAAACERQLRFEPSEPRPSPEERRRQNRKRWFRTRRRRTSRRVYTADQRTELQLRTLDTVDWRCAGIRADAAKGLIAKPDVCSITDCGRDVRSLGLCSRHYQKARRDLKRTQY